MNPRLADTHLWHLVRAWHGACLCRARLLSRDEPSQRVESGDGRAVADFIGYRGHDVDYYAWEAVRIIKIAEKVVAAGLRGKVDVERALADLRRDAPRLEEFRNAVTHVEENRGADGITYFSDAVELKPNGQVEYVLDPRYRHHDLLAALVAAAERALATLAPASDRLPRAFPYPV